MKIIKIGLVGMLVAGLLTACNGNDAKSVAKTDDQPAAVENDTVEFSPEAKEWIAEMAAEFNRAPEESFDELKQEDVGFVYYTKANDLYENMQHYIDDKNESFDEDFANLRMLAAGISHDQFERTAHIDDTGKEKDNLEHAEDWKPVPASMETAYQYMGQLLNDLDVAINKGGKGNSFGVSHLTNGDKVNELESFIKQDS
ncbi:hypothetical protein DFO70_12512 [Cytobacillus firmus]|uniref:Lipoprotein n=2 Tax=Cytobacillus TaxID=2675230 RepID=A0A366JHS9_CYTFI|nr:MULTISPECIES: hypothetical protein [Cytobacillus]RBP86545.1 hypothetical protein DFO70_12512 [Cytobacillus firmus]TDX39286.1 hypothetical protein DFO72_111116 [Cytobacillus oceanisediminis]